MIEFLLIALGCYLVLRSRLFWLVVLVGLIWSAMPARADDQMRRLAEGAELLKVLKDCTKGLCTENQLATIMMMYQNCGDNAECIARSWATQRIVVSPEGPVLFRGR